MRPSSSSTMPISVRAVEGAVASKFRNMGQTCVCANRLLVQDGVYDEFTARLGQAVSAMKVGNGLDPGVVQGPLIDAAAVEKVEEHIADALDKGARGGGRWPPAPARRNLVRADGARRRDRGHEDRARGDVRPGGAPVPLRGRGRRGRDGERHRVRARELLLQSGRRPRLAGLGGARIRHGGSQLGAPVRRGGAVRRGEGVGGSAREGSYQGLDEFLEVKYLCMGGVSA